MRTVLISVSGESIAHSIRPISAALALQAQGFGVLFAGRGPYLRFAREAGFDVEDMPTLSYAQVLHWQAHDRRPLYAWGQFEKMLKAQQARLAELAPDLSVYDGPDATYALAANAVGVKVINIANASTFGLLGRTRYVAFRPVMRRLFGVDGKRAKIVDSLLHLGRNTPLYVSALAAIWRRREMPKIGYDALLMPDLPELFALPSQVGDRRFIGPLLYEPPSEKPAWWSQLDPALPLIYVAMGSSGGETGLKTIVDALDGQGYQVILSTPEAATRSWPKNFFAASFVPRDLVLQRAAAMIFHGGNASAYQAIAQAVPMIAVPGHFDQDLMARALQRQGLAKICLPDALQVGWLRATLKQMLADTDLAQRLGHFQRLLQKSQGPQAFVDVVKALLAAADKEVN